MSDEKKRYWLKLDKDFMKSPHIKVIKKMANGKDYIIFYLTLMLESIETVGHLKFSDLVPYNEEMLSALTDTNLDIVRSAVKIFENLGLIQVLDDGTIYMTQVAQMTGKESESAERVRQFREKQKVIALQCNNDVTKCNDNKEKEKQRTENKEQRIENKEKRIHFAEFVTMTNAEHEKLVSTYGTEFTNQCIETLDNYKGSSGKKYKNDYRAILNWVIDRVKQSSNTKSSNSGNVFFDILREETSV